jgi:hypothetical protein
MRRRRGVAWACREAEVGPIALQRPPLTCREWIRGARGKVRGRGGSNIGNAFLVQGTRSKVAVEVGDGGGGGN